LIVLADLSLHRERDSGHFLGMRFDLELFLLGPFGGDPLGMLKRFDIPVVGEHGLVTGEEEFSPNSILHVDEDAEVTDPFHRLLQNDLHAANSFCWKGKEDTGGAEEKSIVDCCSERVLVPERRLWVARLSSASARIMTALSSRHPIMTARELIEHWAARLTAEQAQLGTAQGDRPLTPVSGRLLETVGTLYLYEFWLPPDGVLATDIPVSVVPDDEIEPAEGLVLSCKDGVALVQTFDARGTTVMNATIVPDRGGFLLRAAERFAHMLAQPDSYRLGPSDPLVSLFSTAHPVD